MRPDLEAAISRIAVPDPREDRTPIGITGELARLLAWWDSVSVGSVPRSAILTTTERPTDVDEALIVGVATAERAIDQGATLLVPRVAVRAPIAALTAIGLLTRTEASAIVFQPAGMTDRAWIDRCAAVRVAGVDVADLRAAPLDALAALGALDIAFVVGALLAGAARRTPSLIDGTDELAAAVVADRLSFRAKEWWRAGSTSPDSARQAAIDRLDLNVGVPLDLIDDEGRGADATIALLDAMTRTRD